MSGFGAITGKFVKGCLVSLPSIGLDGIPTGNVMPRLVVFQFNPGSITRTLKPRINSEAPIQFTGMSEEKLGFTVEFDATDYMADEVEGSTINKATTKANAYIAATTGVAPQLASLELMICPDLPTILMGAAMSQGGVIEIKKPSVPLTLFIWGAKILPVKITELTVEDQVFNRFLVPLRAKVGVKLDVLTYEDFSDWKQLGPWIYGAHHVLKEGQSLANPGLEVFQFVKKIIGVT